MSDDNANQSRWGQPMQHSLTELEAFDAMRTFLEAFWERDGRNSDDGIARILSFTQRGWPNGAPQLPHLQGAPLDIAQWEDWLDAIKATKP